MRMRFRTILFFQVFLLLPGVKCLEPSFSRYVRQDEGRKLKSSSSSDSRASDSSPSELISRESNSGWNDLPVNEDAVPALASTQAGSTNRIKSPAARNRRRERARNRGRRHPPPNKPAGSLGRESKSSDSDVSSRSKSMSSKSTMSSKKKKSKSKGKKAKEKSSRTESGFDDEPTESPSQEKRQEPSLAPTLSQSPSESSAQRQAPIRSVHPSEAPSISESSSPSKEPPSAAEDFETTLAPVGAGTPSSSPTQVSLDGQAEDFETTLDISGIDETFKQTFIDAATRWDSVIVGDLEDVDIDQQTKDDSACENLPDKVDDVFICAKIRPIDGRGGILGSAGPEFARFETTNVLPFVGNMQFDTADVEALIEDGTLDSVIVSHMKRYFIGKFQYSYSLTLVSSLNSAAA